MPISTKNCAYTLEVFQLPRAYRNEDSLQQATRLHAYDSGTPFGEFHIGETFSDSQPKKYLGRIQHIHHWVGESDDFPLLHKTILYIFHES